MKRINWTLLYCGIIVLGSSLFFSCSEEEKSLESEKITFWHFWSEPNQRIALDSLINEFEEETGIRVEMVELSWNDGKAKLLAAFNSQTAPDVIELGSDWIAQFSSEGVLAELNSDEAEIDKFLKFSLDPCVWNNKYYALPWIVHSRVMFCNIELMNKAGFKAEDVPATFTELINQAEKINSLENAYGFGTNGSDAHRLYKKIVPMFWTYGGEILNDSGSVVINSSHNTKALDAYLTLSRIGFIDSQRQIDSEFARGKIGFCFSGSWLLDKIQNENPDLKYQLALLPGTEKVVPGVSFAGGEYLAINAVSKNSEAAKKFINWMCSGENAVKFCRKVKEAGFPADAEFYRDEKLLAGEGKDLFARQLMHARMTPVHPAWLDMEAIIENSVVEALYGRKSSEEALEDAQNKLEQILNK